MKAPACDSGDFCIALRAESTLFIPEIAKSMGTPKRFQHVSPFAFFEVGFIGKSGSTNLFAGRRWDAILSCVTNLLSALRFSPLMN